MYCCVFYVRAVWSIKYLGKEMKISSKTTYGLRFMLTLALEYDKDYIRLKDVAAREGISEKYLESIVAVIKPLGLVDVKRGAYGGYKLSKAPYQISMKELFDNLDGSFIDLETSKGNKSSETYNEQVVGDLWHDLKAVVDGFLSNKTLADLVESHKRKNDNNMYFI